MKLQAKAATARAATKKPEPSTSAPPPKHFQMDEPSEFHLNGQHVTPAKFTGFNFTGLIHQIKVDKRFREKIACDEFFDLSRLYRPEESSEQCIGMNEEGYLSFNVQKPAQPKTKYDIFKLLCLFGQFYLQIYPDKVAGFLEYLYYLFDNTADMMPQGLLKLDTAICRQYVSYPEWNWEQSRYEINHLLPMFKADKSNLLVTQSRNSKFQNTKFNQKSKQSTSRPLPIRSDQKKARCRNYNYRNCQFGTQCFREHVCYDCGATNHKAPTCTCRQTTT